MRPYAIDHTLTRLTRNVRQNVRPPQQVRRVRATKHGSSMTCHMATLAEHLPLRHGGGAANRDANGRWSHMGSTMPRRTESPRRAERNRPSDAKPSRGCWQGEGRRLAQHAGQPSAPLRAVSDRSVSFRQPRAHVVSSASSPGGEKSPWGEKGGTVCSPIGGSPTPSCICGAGGWDRTCGRGKRCTPNASSC